MSDRIYINGHQIFDNNFIDKRIIDEIRRQGGKFYEGYRISNFRLKDFNSLLKIIMEIDKEDIERSMSCDKYGNPTFKIKNRRKICINIG